MAKTLVNLTLGESKTKVDLSLEAKIVPNKTWDEGTDTWNEANYTWASPKAALVREAKTKVSLTLE